MNYLKNSYEYQSILNLNKNFLYVYLIKRNNTFLNNENIIMAL